MPRPVVRLQGLHRRFGDVHAVAGIDLEVRPGEILALLGPNGAGKTTTIRMMAGLLRPSAGRIGLGPHLDSPVKGGARRLIGLCPQENIIYDELTVMENLEYAAALYRVPRRERQRRAKALVHALGLDDKRRARADKLSGGLKRRLTIAMALAHDPDIVVFDEPEGGLDPQSRVSVRSFIRALARTKTVILTSHNMDEVERIAERVVIIDRGRIIADGTPAELKRAYGGGDRVTITTMQPDAAPIARDVAEHVPSVRSRGNQISIAGADLVQHIPRIMAAVKAAGGEIRSVEFKANTLEEVFIALTGRRLRE